MKFNYYAVGKKDRIKKTLLFGIPASIIIGLVGTLAILLSFQLGFTIFYYAAVLGIGYIVGVVVRKIGRGTTVEFLYIAGFLAALSILIAFYCTFAFRGTFLPLGTFFKDVVFTLPGSAGYFSFVEILFGIAVAVSQANTVQIR